jgi:hypothetical protein
VVAACGLVRDPARAIGELCWMLPDPAASEVSLAELLAERVGAQARADAWHARQAAAARRLQQVGVLYDMVRDDGLDEQLGDARAGESFRSPGRR